MVWALKNFSSRWLRALLWWSLIKVLTMYGAGHFFLKAFMSFSLITTRNILHSNLKWERKWTYHLLIHANQFNSLSEVFHYEWYLFKLFRVLHRLLTRTTKFKNSGNCTFRQYDTFSVPQELHRQEMCCSGSGNWWTFFLLDNLTIWSDAVGSSEYRSVFPCGLKKFNYIVSVVILLCHLGSAS